MQEPGGAVVTVKLAVPTCAPPLDSPKHSATMPAMNRPMEICSWVLRTSSKKLSVKDLVPLAMNWLMPIRMAPGTISIITAPAASEKIYRVGSKT